MTIKAVLDSDDNLNQKNAGDIVAGVLPFCANNLSIGIIIFTLFCTDTMSPD